MTKISASIICCDEERNIEACLQSVSWCDEIVVVDSGSQDRTLELARKYTKNILHNDWPGYVNQKNYALDRTSGDWVISLDADEICTPELQEELQRVIPTENDFVAFEVRRHVWYLGRWINHGGWYPDWKLRIIRRGRAKWQGTDPHDKLVADGPVKRLEGEIQHFNYWNFAEQLERINHFSEVVLAEKLKKGKRFFLFMALIHPPFKFLECYIKKRGFLDGWPGFVIAAASSFYVFVKDVKLWEATRQKHRRPPLASEKDEG